MVSAETAPRAARTVAATRIVLVGIVRWEVLAELLMGITDHSSCRLTLYTIVLALPRPPNTTPVAYPCSAIVGGCFHDSRKEAATTHAVSDIPFRSCW